MILAWFLLFHALLRLLESIQVPDSDQICYYLSKFSIVVKPYFTIFFLDGWELFKTYHLKLLLRHLN